MLNAADLLKAADLEAAAVKEAEGFTDDDPIKVEINAARAEDIIARSGETIRQLREEVLRLNNTLNDFSAELDAYYQEFGPLSER